VLTQSPDLAKAAISRRDALSLLGAASLSGYLGGRAAAASPLTLAWTPGAATPQIALALQDRLWDGKDLDVNAVSFPTGREALEALLNGGADIASLAELPVVTAALRGQAFVVLAGLSTFAGNRIFINAASGAKDIASLNGRKVAATLGTNIQFLADNVLGGAGIAAELVNVAPGDTVPALARGDVDAAFMFDTFYPQARAVLGDNAIEIMTPQYKGQFLVVASRSFVDANPDAVKAFVSGLVAADALAADKARAIAAISASTGGTLKPESIDEQWQHYRFEVALNEQLLPLMVAEGLWINKGGLIKTPATEELLRSFIADNFLSELAPERVRL